MPRNFISNLAGAILFHEKVGEAGLRAAALVVQNQARRNVRGGFKSGQFVTGTLSRSISHELLSGKIAVVGTTERHGAYWELGHNNAWTRRYEREEWLRPALDKTIPEQREAATTAMRAAAFLLGKGR